VKIKKILFSFGRLIGCLFFYKMMQSLDVFQRQKMKEKTFTFLAMDNALNINLMVMILLGFAMDIAKT